MLNSQLKRFLNYSLIGHVALIVLLYLSPSFRLPEPRETKVTWIKLSRGDGGTNAKAQLKEIKKLPDSTVREQRDALKKLELLKKLQETKNAKKLEIPKAEVAKQVVDKKTIKIGKKPPPPQKNPVAQKRSQIDEALAKIDEQLKNREDEILQIRKTEVGVAQAKDKNTGQSVFGGEEGNVLDPALIQYYNAVKKKINREWILARQDFSGNIVTKIVVMINGSGQVTRTWFKKTSGDGSFDDSALRAIKKAAPYPPPPQSIREEALTEGFMIEFNPRTVTGSMGTY